MRALPAAFNVWRCNRGMVQTLESTLVLQQRCLSTEPATASTDAPPPQEESPTAPAHSMPEAAQTSTSADSDILTSHVAQQQQQRRYASFDTRPLGRVQIPAELPLPKLWQNAARERQAPLSLVEALKQVKENARARFAETVDLAINLGIDAKRGDQNVRGAAMLPHGTGRQVRLAVFTGADNADVAKSAGADIVGDVDLIETIRLGGSGSIDFDKCIATADMMPHISKIARILGPRGLMPSPKLGTVVTDVATAVRSMKAGRVEFRNDRTGVLHVPIGKTTFDVDALAGNVSALVSTLLSMRPKGLKGMGAQGYLLKCTVSSTMGRGVPISVSSLVQEALTARRRGG